MIQCISIEKQNGMVRNEPKRRNKQTDDQIDKWREVKNNYKSVDKMVHKTKRCQLSYYCLEWIEHNESRKKMDETVTETDKINGSRMSFGLRSLHSILFIALK